MKNSFNIRINPLHKIGIIISNNEKNGQSYYTLNLVGTKKSLNLPYNSVIAGNYMSHAIAFLGTCGIRVANMVNHDHDNTMLIVGFNYYDKVQKLFSYAK
jgi:hypothetical protein